MRWNELHGLRYTPNGPFETLPVNDQKFTFRGQVKNMTETCRV